MRKFNIAASLGAAAVAAVTLMTGSAAHAWNEAPFCSENYSRTGQGRVCTYYTYEQCQMATSGVGGSCSANAWYQGRQYYDHPPRRHRKHKHRHHY